MCSCVSSTTAPSGLPLGVLSDSLVPASDVAILSNARVQRESTDRDSQRPPTASTTASAATPTPNHTAANTDPCDIVSISLLQLFSSSALQLFLRLAQLLGVDSRDLVPHRRICLHPCRCHRAQ